MSLRSLTLDGFKNFAHRTTIRFSPGITCIVGPNGSGKSVVLDALLWACGTRRWKAMRAAEMTDVIWKGSEKAPPATSARVEVLFDNTDGRIRFDHHEVAIARQISRDGARSAEIAGTRVRIRDVADLLLGSGLGDDGLAMIPQRRVDQLILAGGKAINHALEEAAGIAHYRRRREEAAVRLARSAEQIGIAQADAERLDRELTHLQRQANRARKRDALRQEIERTEAHLRAAELRHVRQEYRSLTERIEELRVRKEQLDTELDGLAAERERLEAELAGHADVGPAAADPTAPDPAAAGAIAGRIERAGRSLIAEAGRLRDEGPPQWNRTVEVLRETIGSLREILSEGAGTPPQSSRLSTLAVRLPEISRRERGLGDRRMQLVAELERASERAGLLAQEIKTLPGTPQASHPSDLPADPRDLRDQLDGLTAQLAKLGRVDETALDREAEVQARVDALVREINDLNEAHRKLNALIDELETQARELYREAVERTSAGFDSLVKRLFGGGEGALIPRPDETIDLRARLPNKDHGQLSLLSGGERSLVGIALVLALESAAREEQGQGGILLLDEVDDALDQANAERFAQLLNDLSTDTQIVVVSHNKATMLRADHLLGVTLDEAGAARIMSVQLQDAGAHSRSRVPTVRSSII